MATFWETAKPLKHAPEKHATFSHLSNREITAILFCRFKAKRPITQIAKMLGRSTRTVWLEVKKGSVALKSFFDLRHRSHALKLHMSQAFKIGWRYIAGQVRRFINGEYTTLEKALGDDDP